MDVDKFEEELNSFESSPQKILSEILSLTAKNQAVLKVVIDNQLLIMSLIDDKLPMMEITKECFDRINKALAMIEADVSSRL